MLSFDGVKKGFGDIQLLDGCSFELPPNGIVGVLGAILAYYLLDSKELKEITTSFHSKFFKKNVIGPQ